MGPEPELLSNDYNQDKTQHTNLTSTQTVKRQTTLRTMIPYQFLPLLVAYWPHMLMGLFLYTMWFLVKDK